MRLSQSTRNGMEPPNFCGHAVLNAGNYYFHVDGRYEFPWYLTEPGYRRYLKTCEKRELRRIRVVLPNPEGAQRKLEELSAQRWRWMVLPHNCASYVEEVFQAGGSKTSSLSNCPVARWA